MKLHLPSLQAAAAVAMATPKEKYCLRLVQVIPGRTGRGHRYLATADGKVAISAEHHCHEVVKGISLNDGPIVGEVPVAGTELPRDKRLLIWAPSVPKKRQTKAEMREGSWIDTEESALPVWTIDIGAREVRLGGDGPKIPGDVGTTHLTGVPHLETVVSEFIPGNLHAGTTKRINANFVALLAEASDLMARGTFAKFTTFEQYGDTPSLEWFERERRESTPVLVDLTAQRWHDDTLPQAWAVVMPIQRRDKDAQFRGIQPVEPTP